MVDGIFVQKGTLAASFAAAATPKKLPPPSSAASRAKIGISSGGRIINSKSRAPSGGAAKSQPSHLTGTRPNGTSGPNAAADRLSTASSDRLVDSCGREGSSSAGRGMGEEGRRPGLTLEGAETAFAAGESVKAGGKWPGVSMALLNGGGGGGGNGGASSDGDPAAPLSLYVKKQPTAAGDGPSDAAAAPPASSARVSGNEGEHTPAGDNDNGNGNDRDTLRFKSKIGEGRDEPKLPPSKEHECGDSDGGSGGAGGGSSDVGWRGYRGGAATAGDHPPPFELPDMGAAGEGGRSTKDDPAFMKTFFRNSRLHFIGVG